MNPDERKIAGIYRGSHFHWVGNGFRVSNYFPSGNDLAQKISPYILLDYHPPYNYSPNKTGQRGVGPHPHRGFETVTVAFEGSIAHNDSTGGGGVIGPGDVQWMTAASGILHKEYHAKEFSETGGTMHMMQIWVNLPRIHKMAPPRYQAITASEIATVDLPDGAGEVRVIAGSYEGTKGPAATFSPINMFDIRLHPGGRVELSFPAHENTAVMMLNGEATINGHAKAAALDLVLFENSGRTITVEASAETHLLVLNGEPIDEPAIQYGPFVMNTEQEIQQAIDDFNSGKFGYLEG